MAGTIPLSLTQQLDEFGNPLSGGQLYLIQAGTVSTPQNAFQDTALSIALPNPITLDSAGRLPQFFLADGQIKVRLQDKLGVVKFVADNLQVIGPSTGGGGGGGGAVDPTTVLQTGDIKFRYDNAILTGFVRCNGKTIGNAVSGATELADPSAQALFNFLWLVDLTLAVTPGGRGANAAADWAANKQIALPDGRARDLMGLADMGNSNVGLLAGVTFTKGNAITLGSQAGAGQRLLATANLPAHQHNVYTHDPTHAHSYTLASGVYTAAGGGTAVAVSLAGSTTGASATGLTVGSVPGVANDNLTTFTGGSTAFDIVSPAMLITVYLKL
jgi:microcystin-dependent protein